MSLLILLFTQVRSVLRGPHRLDPRNPLPVHFSLWPSAPHVHPLAYRMSLLSTGPNLHLYDAESEFLMTFPTQTSHLPHPSPGPISQAPQIQQVQNLTHCHSSIPSGPTLPGISWEWLSWGKKSCGVGNGCIEASKDNDNVSLLALHSEHKGVYLLQIKIVLKKKNLLDYDHWKFWVIGGGGSQKCLLGL